MPTSAMTALATITLASAQATVTFSSISGAYRDLRLVAQISATTGSPDLNMTINSDAGTNYNRVFMQGDGAGAGSSSAANTTSLLASSNSVWMTTNISNLVIDFLDYSATDKHKSLLIRYDNSALGTSATAARWASTSAITSFILDPSGASTFAIGSTFTLYGVSA